MVQSMAAIFPSSIAGLFDPRIMQQVAEKAGCLPRHSPTPVQEIVLESVMALVAKYQECQVQSPTFHVELKLMEVSALGMKCDTVRALPPSLRSRAQVGVRLPPTDSDDEASSESRDEWTYYDCEVSKNPFALHVAESYLPLFKVVLRMSAAYP